MKTLKIFGLVAVALGIITAFTIQSCSAEKVAAYKNKSGAQLWGETCVRCHNTPSPASFNDTDWSTIELHMKVRANLTKEQSDKIFEFIRSVNTTKTVTDPIVEKKTEVKTTTPVETKSETKIEAVIDAPVETKTVTDPMVEKKTEVKTNTPVETKSETKIADVIDTPVETKTKPIVTETPKNVWMAPASADAIENPFKTDAASIKKGQKIFVQLCVVCHGNKGKGDGIAGAALTPKPANFTLSSFQSHTDGAIFWKITNGNPPMASYKDILSEEERWSLVNYLRTL